jgi:phage-related minor tail protein
VSDFRLNVIAETQAAERKLKQVEQVADKATRERKLHIDLRSLNQGFNTLKKDIDAASNNIRTFYSISKNVPGIGDKVKQFESLAKNTAITAKEQFQLGAALKENAKAGSILANSLELAAGKGSQLINALAKVGFATFAVKEAVGILQAAWNGFFNNTIGREIKLRETILKTQTTLASTNRVFADGKEITDPYQKIVSLTGAVADRIDSIRERSIALAGVTSNDVIEVFGIVASQVGQIGGGLKEAEDLAINFAAALGTFGLPIYQARQEIGSILRGQITEDSYLAKSLGIRSEDIAKARSEVGGVVKFLEDRLAASVAGQKIAAEGFSGVVSNIADLGELIGQNFGRGLLDPLLAGLSSVFETLFRIRTQIFAIAEGAGRAIGSAGRLIVGLTAGRTGIGAGDPSRAAAAAADVAQRGFSQIQQVAQRTVGALSQAIEALKPTALILIDAFKNIAEAFVKIKVGSFEAIASALANIASVLGAISQPLATVFNLYSRFLNTPAVQYFSEVAAVLGLLKRVGLDAVTQFVLFGRFIFGSVIPAVGGLGTALGGLVAVIAAVILAVGKLIVVLAGLATALVGPAAAIPALATGLKALGVELLSVGKQAVSSGTKLNGLAAGFRGLGAGAKAAGASILASLGWLAVIQIGIAAIIDAFGRFQRAQEDQRSNARAAEALRRLQTTYKDVGDSADSATKSARDFEQAIVNANYNRNIDQLEEVRKKINQIRYELKPGIQSWGEFWSAVFGSEAGRFEEGARQQLQGLQAEEARIKEQLRGVDAQRNREQAQRDIRLQAQNRTNLEKEIGELRRQIDNDLFQQRQSLAQKEVEIFRLAGELRIKQIERANEKLLEGEEGASRAALEALNNYIATRERGELEIEASKKTLAIEVTNLEKAISDYRYDIEKKIAELRKKSADYERNAADARQRAAGGTTPAAPGVTAGFRVGSTGESTGPHLDIRSPTGNKQAVIDEATAIIKAWQGQGLEYIELSNAKIDVKNMFDEAQLREALVKEQTVHGQRASGGAIDIAVPAGTLVPTPVGTPSWGGAGGWQATSLQTGNIFLHGQGTSVASPAGERAAAPADSATAGGADMPEASEAAKNYANAVRSLAGAMERLRALQAALTEANTAEAFDQIAKSAFPQAAIEKYQDSLIEAAYNYEAVAAGADKAFNPERASIEVARLSQIATSNRELGQILKGIEEQTKLSDAEKLKAIDAVKNKHAEYLRGLEQEAQLKNRILTTEQATQFISDMQAQVRNTKNEIEDLTLRNRLIAEGVAPEFIAAELTKLNINREMERISAQLNQELANQIALRDELNQKLEGATDAEKADLQKRLDAALAEIERIRTQIGGVGAAGAAAASSADAKAAAETKPGEKIKAWIGSMKAELGDLEGLAVRVGQSITTSLGNAMANAVSGMIEGTTTAKQAFADFLKEVGRMLVQEGTKMIAMYIAIGIAKMFAGLSGGGNMGGKNYFDPMTGKGVAGPNFGLAKGGAFDEFSNRRFAKGGTFTNSVVSSPTLFKFADGGAVRTGLMGEAGPEAIMPLKRNSSGRLGVEASGLREAMGSAPGNANSSPVLNMSFESTNIGGVEYVSRDQLEQAMAATRRQAANDGAKRGMSMTLDRLQQSPQTRRRVGI